MTKLTVIQNALHAASIEIDGQRWVRAATVIKALKLSPGWYSALPRRWHVTELRVPSRPARGSSRGVEIYWLLDGLLRFARDRARLRSHRTWTAEEDASLIALLKDHTIRAAAVKLSRSFDGVMDRIDQLGGLRTIWREHHRLITAGGLMALTRKRAYDTIRRWRSLGLRHVVSPGGRDTLFDLHDVREFLIAQPNLLITLDPAARKLLRLTTAELEGRAA